VPPTLTITATETVTVLEDTPALLAVEARYGRADAPPPPHLHPGQDERFTVLRGVLEARVAGTARTLRPGDVLEVPRGTVHQMHNAGEEEARVRWETRPAGRTLAWWTAFDALHRAGRVGRGGLPGPLDLAVLLHEYDDVFRLAARPRAVVRGAIAALALSGRALGRSPAPAAAAA
jgi:quercetin dioxygenase-like cupin family protein